MSAPDLRRTLRARQKELRRSIKQRRAEARAKLAQNPLIRQQRARRRVRNGIAAAAVVLLVLLARCQCTVAPAPPEPVAEVVAPQPPKPKPAPKPKPKPLSASMDPQQRGTYSSEKRSTASWVDDFRLQVAARSARLADCFTGIDKPGALRWTTSVNAESGAVSDHELEALASSMPLWAKEKTCLIGVLSNPPYKITGAPEQPEGLPNRVSIVIEF